MRQLHETEDSLCMKKNKLIRSNQVTVYQMDRLWGLNGEGIKEGIRLDTPRALWLKNFGSCFASMYQTLSHSTNQAIYWLKRFQSQVSTQLKLT